jgi:hypothetical protein
LIFEFIARSESTQIHDFFADDNVNITYSDQSKSNSSLRMSSSADKRGILPSNSSTDDNLISIAGKVSKMYANEDAGVIIKENWTPNIREVRFRSIWWQWCPRLR